MMPPTEADPTVTRAVEVDCRMAANPQALRGACMVPTPAITVPNVDIVVGTSAAATTPANGPTQVPTAAVKETIFNLDDVIVSVLSG